MLVQLFETTSSVPTDYSAQTETSASLRLFAGEHPSAEGNQLLTTLELEGIHPAPAGEVVLKVVLEVSAYYECAFSLVLAEGARKLTRSFVRSQNGFPFYQRPQ